MLPFIDGPSLQWHFDNMLWSWFALVAVVALVTARLAWVEFETASLRMQYTLHVIAANVILWSWLVAANLEDSVWEVAVGWLVFSLGEYLFAMFVWWFVYALYKACKREWEQN